jgi:YaaC-like Protein
MHTYIEKSFGSIPRLFIVAPLSDRNRYSQLCVTYLLTYILGMLARYYPTHWISLAQGEKGDALWPAINRAQHFVEDSFPELAIELILDVLSNPNPN